MHVDSLLHRKYYGLASADCPGNRQRRPLHPCEASHHPALRPSWVTLSSIVRCCAQSARGCQGISAGHRLGECPRRPVGSHSFALLQGHHQNSFLRTCCPWSRHCRSHGGLAHICAAIEHVSPDALDRCLNDTRWSAIQGQNSKPAPGWSLSRPFRGVKWSLLAID